MNLAAAIKRAEAIMNKRAEDEQFDPVYRYEQMQRAIEGAGQKLPTDILDPAGKNISNVFRGPADSILGSQPKRLPPAEVPGIPQYQLRKAVQGALAEKAHYTHIRTHTQAHIPTYSPLRPRLRAPGLPLTHCDPGLRPSGP